MGGEDDPARTSIDAYDDLAEDYADDLEASPYHADLAFPGTVAEIPEVDDKRVLDAGCGTGAYTEWLLDRGATVVGVDASEAMLDQARERFADVTEDRVTLRQADLADPLPFEVDSFDGIVSALALDYVEDWDAVFAEFARVLADGGFVVVTVPHPFDEFPLEEAENYFAVEQRVKEWNVDVPYYRRPVSAMVQPLLDAGFRLETLAEPEPTERFEARWPERYETESRHPVFLTLRGRYEVPSSQ